MLFTHLRPRENAEVLLRGWENFGSKCDDGNCCKDQVGFEALVINHVTPMFGFFQAPKQ